ncbi:MAG TPA: DUF364 domain-containing protein [Anaerolineaceae bacterium]|nr:DUF364 domain-containing protein [Anaerolineaceae bacterium]
MNLLEALLAALPVDHVPVRKVVIGVHWTAVCSKGCGLGSTLVNCGPHGHSSIRDVGSLHHKTAQELAEWILSDNLLEASIGMAAINSLTEVDEGRLVDINAAEVIKEKSKDRNLAVVGHFPFIEKIRNIPCNCWVIEKQPFGDDFPEKAAGEYIPQADVVAITGTAFINHTIEYLLSLCRPSTMVMVLGPSTPMLPLLFNHGIHYLSGSRIVDEEAAIATIQQGASFPQVKGVRVVTMEK